ncbi:globin domain-containing protein [Tahibacter caeni]|uniref:globin domain-containing protein n=1 Tax=Tahibacter caeni TaxID=1453545 RepID=UPI0021479AE6|nr:globin domain-containing protein [Tahibacter caeni]
MYDLDIQRVRESYAAIGDGAGLGRGFYAQLFRLRPDARALFPADLDQQVRKLIDMLGSIVRALDAPSQLARDFAELGRRHLGYGVSEEDYDDVGAALLMALREQLGPAFTPEVEQAWATLYGDLAEAMIAAENGASPPA